MPTRSLAVLLLVATSTMLVACAGGGSMAPATPAATLTLSVSPQSVTFDIGQPVPPLQTVVVSGSALTSGVPLVFSIADPTVVGVTPVMLVDPGPPIYAIHPVAHGSTTISFTSGTVGASVTATSGTCGRPDFLRPESQLIFPQPGSTGVPTNLGKLYFAVAYPSFSLGPSTVLLNLIVGQHATQIVSVSLQADTAPSGSATPAPVPNVKYQVMSVPVPLMPGSAYRTQLYDDACQPAILTGAFTTA